MMNRKRGKKQFAHGAVHRVTAREVAEKLGVSMMTVSRALNNRPYVNPKTRKRVLETSMRLGYSPNHIAKSLVLRKTHTIGVVIPEIAHSFFPEAIRGIEEVAYKMSYHLILMHSAEDAARERDAIRTLESHRVDGILLSTAQTVVDYKIYKHLIRVGMPITFFDRCVRGLGASCVSMDDEDSARRITEHLIDHGYDRIAHLSGPVHVSIGGDRLRGFQQALEKRSIPLRSELVVESGLHELGGYKAMKRLLELPVNRRPRAVVAVNDPAAFGAIRAITESGLRVPDDIAIVGFSDDIRGELIPTPLTTVRQPAYEVGKLAAQRLIAQISGKSMDGEELIVTTELILRQSCGCDKSISVKT